MQREWTLNAGGFMGYGSGGLRPGMAEKSSGDEKGEYLTAADGNVAQRIKETMSGVSATTMSWSAKLCAIIRMQVL